MVDCPHEAGMIYFVSKILIFTCMHADILVYYDKGVLLGERDNTWNVYSFVEDK